MADANLSPGMAVGSNGSVMTSKFSGRVLTAAVIFIFLMVIFAIFLYIYWKNKWIPGIATHGRAHFIITADDTTIARRGLGAAVLPSLPLAIFRRSGFKDGIECSVCLCELSDGDKFRLLPKCSHGFHVDCIDMWLHSHLTCPLCRCPVGPEAAAAGELSPATDGGQPSSRSPVLPTSVLLWRNNGRFSTRGLVAHSERSLVITIPNRFADGLEMPMTQLGSGCCSGENLKSPAEESRSAGTSKLESLRRMLSRGKRSGGSSCSSPVEGDVEKGVVRCEKEEGGSSNVSKPPVSNSVRSFPSSRSKLEY